MLYLLFLTDSVACVWILLFFCAITKHQSQQRLSRIVCRTEIAMFCTTVASKNECSTSRNVMMKLFKRNVSFLCFTKQQCHTQCWFSTDTVESDRARFYDDSVWWGLNDTASDLRSRGRMFEPRPGRICVATLGKLFAPMCLSLNALVALAKMCYINQRFTLHYIITHTHTHPFNGPFSGTTQVGRYQKGKTSYAMHTIKLLLTYYLNISVQAANLSDCRIESNRSFFCPNWNALLSNLNHCEVH